MNDRIPFIEMLVGAQVSFTNEKLHDKGSRVEIDGGNGAVMVFQFDARDMLMWVALDKDAY